MQITSPALAAASGQKPTPQTDRMANAAREFEGMMIGQMLEPMWAGLKADGPFGGGSHELVYRSLMIQEIGRSIAERGGLGLADEVARTLLQAQEAKTQ